MKFLVVSCVAVSSLAVNIMLWSASGNAVDETTANVSPAVQSRSGKTDFPPAQQKEIVSVTSGQRSTGAESCNSTAIEKKKLFESLDQQDYRSLSGYLLEAGLPESMVRRLVFSYLNNQNVQPQDNSQSNYWQQASVNPADSATALLKSSAAKRDQLLALFGAEVKDDPAFYALFRPYQQKLGFLSSEKQIALQELQLASITGGVPKSPMQIQQEIENILGAEDYYEYQLRESPMASRLQQQLAAFDYSEQDYRELFRIKYSSGGQPVQSVSMSGADFGLNGMTPSTNPAEEEAIRAYLGEERYQEYSLSQQPDYRRMVHIADVNGINRDDSMTAYQVMAQARKQLNELYQNASLNAEDKNYRIDAVLSDTNVQLSSLVGDTVAQELVAEVLESPRLYRN